MEAYTRIGLALHGVPRAHGLATAVAAHLIGAARIAAGSAVFVVAARVRAGSVAKGGSSIAAAGARNAVLGFTAGAATTTAIGGIREGIDTSSATGRLAIRARTHASVAGLLGTTGESAGSAVGVFGSSKCAHTTAVACPSRAYAQPAPATLATRAGEPAATTIIRIDERAHALPVASGGAIRTAALSARTILPVRTCQATSAAILTVSAHVDAPAVAVLKRSRTAHGALASLANLTAWASFPTGPTVGRIGAGVHAGAVAVRGGCITLTRCSRAGLTRAANRAASATIIRIGGDVFTNITARKLVARAAAAAFLAVFVGCTTGAAGAAIHGILGKIETGAVAGAERHRARVLAGSVGADFPVPADVAAGAAITGITIGEGAGVVAAAAAVGAFTLGIQAFRGGVTGESAGAAIPAIRVEVYALAVAILETSGAHAGAPGAGLPATTSEAAGATIERIIQAIHAAEPAS